MDIGEIIGYISTAIGGGLFMQIIHWRTDKKKASVEIQASEIQLISETVRTVYEPIIEQQNRRIQQLDDEVQMLREEKRNMQKDYQEQIAKLEKRMLELSKAVGLKATARARASNGQFIKAEE